MIKQLITLIKQNTYYARTLLFTCLLLLFIDGLNIREQLQHMTNFTLLITNFRLYQINVELWVTLFASIFAILGTYLFTRNENLKLTKSQQLITNKNILNQLVHIQALEYIFNSYIDIYEYLGEDIPDYIELNINNTDFPYLHVLKEMNIINNIFSENNINFKFNSDNFLYRVYSTNEAIFHATVSLHPEIKYTYINSKFFENISEINLYDMLGFDYKTISQEFIILHINTILSKLETITHYFDIDIPILNTHVSPEEVYEVLDFLDQKISNLIQEILSHYYTLKHDVTSFNQYDSLFRALDSLTGLYYLKHKQHMSYTTFDLASSINFTKAGDTPLSTSNNAILLINKHDFEQYITHKKQYLSNLD